MRVEVLKRRAPDHHGLGRTAAVGAEPLNGGGILREPEHDGCFR